MAMMASLSCARTPAPTGDSSGPAQVKCRSVEYEGTWIYEGHFSQPGEKRRYPTRVRWSIDDQGQLNHQWTIYEDGQDRRGTTETVLVSEARVFWREEESDWQRVVGAEANWRRIYATHGLQAVLEEAGTHSKVSGAVAEYVRTFAHPRLGDVRSRVRFGDGEPVPETLSSRQYEPYEPNEFDLTLVDHASLCPAEWFVAPRQAETKEPMFQPPADVQAIRRSIAFSTVADQAHTLDIEATDSRVLVIEFIDHLVVCEAPVSSATGEAILAELRERFPAKPVTHVFVGHYHPHYTGGLRAFIAAGANVVTTAGNAELVEAIAARPFTIQPDALAKSPRPLRQTSFRGRSMHEDRSQTLVAIDIGARSQHTDEYVVFHLPRAGLLFQGDLGWFTLDGELRASRRASGLLEVARSLDPSPRRLIQSWPIKDNAAELDIAKLEELVER